MTIQEKIQSIFSQTIIGNGISVKQVVKLEHNHDSIICLGTVPLPHYELIHCHYDIILDRIEYVSLTNHLN